MTQMTITDLDTALGSGQDDGVLSAAWYAFDAGGQLADVLARDENQDEIQAMLLGIKCMEGRALLPLPESGGPLEPLAECADRARLEPYGVLLRHVDAALRRLASVPGWADDAEQLIAVADHAAVAADILANIRQDGVGAS
ncbi:hypothetical protein GCM10010348_61490 [Streptomyces anthocyanicus]|uniref:hypothetical protein n=1 Tax=Streptomyces anthocyanicus TaxID=68174 RepID=UPI001874C11F|nr:hypothetical protein [Streptomyces anthocyanicus]GHC27279.1 hypothetical protein GCM10010348_61490 [Streptomyces anthocyanicus]